MEESDPNARPWYVLADQFSAHCRLGFLAGVMLEESPFGNLNIRVTTMDPEHGPPQTCRCTGSRTTKGKTEDAEHWLSVGTATCPAHDVDPEYPDLLADVPEGARPGGSGARDRCRSGVDPLPRLLVLPQPRVQPPVDRDPVHQLRPVDSDSCDSGEALIQAHQTEQCMYGSRTVSAPARAGSGTR